MFLTVEELGLTGCIFTPAVEAGMGTSR